MCSVTPQAKYPSQPFCIYFKRVEIEEGRTIPRLLAQEHKEFEKEFIIGETVSLRHSSLHITLNSTFIMGYAVWLQNGDQAYIQSEHALQRPVYIKPPRQLNFGSEILWKMLEPQYGLCHLEDYLRETSRRH